MLSILSQVKKENGWHVPLVELSMPGRLSSSHRPHVPHMLMHILVRQCVPHEASQIRMTPCNRFETSQPRRKKRHSHHKTSPAHSRPKYISHTQQQSRSIALIPASCLSPSRQVLKKRSGIGVEEKILLFSQTTRRARLSDSPGRKGYKETSGEVAVEDVIMLEEKRAS